MPDRRSSAVLALHPLLTLEDHEEHDGERDHRPDRERVAGDLYGWRFQATDDAGQSFVFDVFESKDGWHVHRRHD
jgi:hypothetical protein